MELAWHTFLNQERILSPFSRSHGSLDNPLPRIMRQIKINYNWGGYFELKGVRLAPASDQFVDYQILIENVKDRQKYARLRRLSDQHRRVSNDHGHQQ